MRTLRVILMEWMLTTSMWFRRLVADLLSPQTRFEPGPIHVRISGGRSDSGTGFFFQVWWFFPVIIIPPVLLWQAKWHWDQVFFECDGFPLSISFHQFSSGRRSDIETGFSSSVMVFPCQYNSTSSPLTGKVTLRPHFLRVCWFSPVIINPPVLRTFIHLQSYS
jgi:hypothetical protein